MQKRSTGYLIRNKEYTTLPHSPLDAILEQYCLRNANEKVLNAVE